MNDQKIDQTCKHCGQAFSVFLSEMAEQNRKITCPNCGKANEGSSQAIGGQSPKEIRKKSD
jgi:predicted Zn finger-like uncharacterized protein